MFSENSKSLSGNIRAIREFFPFSLVEDAYPSNDVLESRYNGPDGGSPDQEHEKIWHRSDVGRPKSENDRAELKSRSHLAGDGRTDFERMGRPEENHEPNANDDVPADHDDRQPRRKKVQHRQGGVRRGIEELVRCRVQIRAQHGFLIEQPGQKPVNGIADRGSDEGEEGPPVEMLQKENDK